MGGANAYGQPDRKISFFLRLPLVLQNGVLFEVSNVMNHLFIMVNISHLSSVGVHLGNLIVLWFVILWRPVDLGQGVIIIS